MIINEQEKREKVECPICDKPSNWVTDEHCYCMECCKEFDPITGKIYRIGEDGRLIRIKGNN